MLKFGICEGSFVDRNPEYVIPSKWDDIIYKNVKKEIERFLAVAPIIRSKQGGRIIYSGSLKVTSEVLARLAEQECKFSAYRVGLNKYLVEQISNPHWNLKLND